MKANLKTTFFVLALMLVAGTSSSFDTPDLNYGWERLGSRVVNYKLDRDVIRVTRSEGTFRKLKIRVTGGSVNMHKLIVQYGNGTKDVLPLRHNFGPRSGSRVIDLQGGNRVIRDITFYYDTKDRSRKRAKVHVYAR